MYVCGCVPVFHNGAGFVALHSRKCHHEPHPILAALLLQFFIALGFIGSPLHVCKSMNQKNHDSVAKFL